MDGRIYYAGIWEERLGSETPLAPFAVGVLLAAALIGGFFLTQWMLGASVVEPAAEALLPLQPGARVVVLLALAIGYSIGAFGHWNRGVRRDCEEFGIDPGRLSWSQDESREVLIASRRAGLAGVGLAALVIVGIFVGFGDERERLLDAEFVWGAALTALLFWILARATVLTVHSHRSLSARQLARSDVLNVRRLRLFGRMALRNVLVWMIGLALGLPFLFDPTALATMLPGLAIILGLAGISLVLPVRSVHRAIRDAKRAELARVEQELRRERDAVMRGDARQSGRLADLLGYLRYVEDLSAWPFDASMLRRFGLYLLIPLASWVCGALVERAIDTLLD